MNVALGTHAYSVLFIQDDPLLLRQILIKFQFAAGQPHVMSGVRRNLGLNSFDEREIVSGSVRRCQNIERCSGELNRRSPIQKLDGGIFEIAQCQWVWTSVPLEARQPCIPHVACFRKGNRIDLRAVHAWLRGCALSYRSSPVGVTA